MIRRPFSLAVPLLLLLIAAGGCTHYEYDLVAPPELARHVGSNGFETVRPGYYESRPSIGLGVGFGFSSARRHGWGGRYGGYYDPFFYDEPRYYTYYDESDATYFNWEGETDARLHLVYQRGPDTFTHD